MPSAIRDDAVSPRADALHRDTVIAGGLVFLGDGSIEALEPGNVSATNVTVCHLEAYFERACDEMAVWLARLEAPE